MSSFDIVVVGGGPAGMMAAARAAQYGARVMLIERNQELGRKLMITGRGRCNFAHAEEDAERLASEYRHGGEFLLPALKKFGTAETKAFFLRRGVVPVQERGHRIYPKEGQDASSIVNALWTALKDGSVHVIRGMEVRGFDFLGGKARRVLTGKDEIGARAFIIATGGLSFPNTGCRGDGYRWAKKAGHEVSETVPALCPVKLADRFEADLSGLKLKNVRVTLKRDGEMLDERFGEMDFTPFGISGAIIMDMASAVNDALKTPGKVSLHIDLKPALEPERLDARIGRDFEEFSGDALRFALRKMLPKEIIPDVIKKAGLDMGKPCGETTPEERAALRDVLKDFAVTPTGLLGFNHAIITAGGVRTDEIDPETMASKLIPNLFFAGEILDIDGPTGGYNLQECWSTGFIAGSAAAELLGFTAPTDDEIVRQMVAAQNRRDEKNRQERQKMTEEQEKTEMQEDTDMTIKNGPVDDAEFCGWRDPRKDAAENVGIVADASDAEGVSEDTPQGEKADPDAEESGSAYRREDSDTERPYRRHDGDRREGGYDRRERSGRSYRDERPSSRRSSDRPYRRYNEGEGRYGGDRAERPYRGEGGYRNQGGRSERPYRDERPYRGGESSDRPYRRYNEGEGRYDGDRAERPYRGESGYRNQSGHADRPYRDERPYRGGESSDRPYRRYNEGEGRYGGDRTERPYRGGEQSGGRPFRRYEGERPNRANGENDRPYRRYDREDGGYGKRTGERSDRPHRSYENRDGGRPYDSDRKPYRSDYRPYSRRTEQKSTETTGEEE